MPHFQFASSVRSPIGPWAASLATRDPPCPMMMRLAVPPIPIIRNPITIGRAGNPNGSSAVPAERYSKAISTRIVPAKKIRSAVLDFPATRIRRAPSLIAAALAPSSAQVKIMPAKNAFTLNRVRDIQPFGSPLIPQWTGNGSGIEVRFRLAQQSAPDSMSRGIATINAIGKIDGGFERAASRTDGGFVAKARAWRRACISAVMEPPIRSNMAAQPATWLPRAAITTAKAQRVAAITRHRYPEVIEFASGVARKPWF